MPELLIVSFIWAFSFGLIKDNLSGLNSNFVSFARLALPLLVFLPLVRVRRLPRRTAVLLICTGAVQYGLMYISYIYSFRFLKAYEVALFTIFTPFYVTLIDNLFNRRLMRRQFLAALLAVIGTAVVQSGGSPGSDLLQGFLIVQVSNVCFAFGQVGYKKLMLATPGFKDHQVFGLLYLGAAGLTALSTTLFAGWPGAALTDRQGISLVYLGLVASGLGFFLWNRGARKVNTGALAVFNNLKIPLAVLVSLVVFKEPANLLTLFGGGLLIVLALAVSEFRAWPEQN
jgi:carboxylate/amino acid/amine transporter